MSENALFNVRVAIILDIVILISLERHHYLNISRILFLTNTHDFLHLLFLNLKNRNGSLEKQLEVDYILFVVLKWIGILIFINIEVQAVLFKNLHGCELP